MPTWSTRERAAGSPVNLVEDPTNYSGFRPIQILAASLAVQCRKLAQTHASFVLPTEGDNQDVNSLGTHAAFDLRSSVEHLEQLAAILLMATAQALEMRGISNAGLRSQAIVARYREAVPTLSEDRLIHEDLMVTVEFLRRMGSLETVPANPIPSDEAEGAERSSAVWRRAVRSGERKSG